MGATLKGKVERGVAYAQDNALKGRVFPSLAEQNRHLADWERQVADHRGGPSLHLVEGQHPAVHRPALAGQGEAEEEPVEAEAPGARREGGQAESLPVLGVGAPADAAALHPPADGVEVLPREAEARPDCREVEEIEDLGRGEAGRIYVRREQE